MISKHWNSAENAINLIISFFGLIIVVFVISVPAVCAEPKLHLYSTGTAMEVDNCASAWLIKRFIDKKAYFKFYPEDSLITEGTVFDRPEGNLQRTHNAATFEVILHRYKLADARLQKLAELIHDVEINFWGKKKHPEAGKLTVDIQKIINSSISNEEFYAGCFSHFDSILNTFATQSVQ